MIEKSILYDTLSRFSFNTIYDRKTPHSPI